MRVYVDAETTGLVRTDRPATEWHSQPRPVQVAAVLVDEEWVERAVFAAVIKPDGWTIPAVARDVHGVSTERAALVGMRSEVACRVLANFLRLADEAVAWNFPFDEAVVVAEFFRLGLGWPPWPDRRVCAMAAAEPVVALSPTAKQKIWRPNARFKAPSLSEAHLHFFRRPFEGAHDALADVRAAIAVDRRVRAEGGRRDGKLRGLVGRLLGRFR